MLQAVRRTLDVLETVAAAPDRALPLGELARAAKLNPATCAHIAGSLVEAGYLEQTARRGGYRLGPMAYRLTGGRSYRQDLIDAAKPIMDDLARELGENILLAVLQNGRRVALYESDGGNEVQARREPVQLTDPFATATGRRLAASLPEKDLQELLADRTWPLPGWPEAGTPATLRQLLAEIRQGGLANRDTGSVVGLALAVPDAAGATVASLGVYLPAFRFVDPHRQAVRDGLAQGAARIAAALSSPPTAAGRRQHQPQQE